MRKLIITLLLLCTVGLSSAVAQSAMTEKQIVEYVKKQHEAGKSNEDIAKDLVKRGVTPEQIKRIKEKYERQGQDGAVDLVGATTESSRQSERMRNQTGVQQRPHTVVDVQDALEGLNTDSVITQEENLTMQPEQKKVFGRDIFNNNLLTFEPNENVATPVNYILGAGDEVFIDIYGGSQKSIDTTISPDGMVTIDGVGPVKVGGMTVGQANSRLRAALADRYAASEVQLTVGKTRSISVNVMGEVQAPGTYTISAFATAFHALYAAGGINNIGTLRNIFVYRDGRKVADIDVYDYILHGRTRSDVHLQTGDVIYVGPYFSMVSIEGKVKRPMFYELRQNETLATLLGFAGDFTGDAYKQNVRVVRKNGYDYTIHTVEEFDYNAFKLLDCDAVAVEGIVERYSNMVEVRGAVFRPGMYQMDGQVKTVRELLKAIGGVQETALKNRAAIFRMKADRSREVKAFNLAAVIDGTATDIPLQNEDIIQIYDQETTRAGRTLSIYGQVNFPGVYEFAEGTTIEDLILQAGGLTDAASLQSIEVSRRQKDLLSVKATNSIVNTFSFTLNEDLSIENGSSFVLEPYDEVYIRRSPTWNATRSVRIEGEVAFEGSYALQRKDERLSEIVARAGGLTDYAYAEGAHLERTMTEEELERKKALLRLSQAMADSIDATTLDISNVYSVAINLKEAVAHPGGIHDIILSAGDRLVIPELRTLVKVNGAVMYPNAVSWQKGKRAKYYIMAAGGYSSKAKKSKAFVVNMNGSTQKAKKVKAVMPGSEIVVPTRSEKKRMSTTEVLALSTGTATIATMIATLVNIFK